MACVAPASFVGALLCEVLQLSLSKLLKRCCPGRVPEHPGAGRDGVVLGVSGAAMAWLSLGVALDEQLQP